LRDLISDRMLNRDDASPALNRIRERLGGSN